ncbi:hypothetical protein KEM52_002602 [Ascosphaera acerosa]|nr:hypothetical protein KEM52_002602 [Ascosphaera acerosa]
MSVDPVRTKCSSYTDCPVDCSAALDLSGLAKKSVVITGGATGLGRAYVQAFVEAGWVRRQNAPDTTMEIGVEELIRSLWPRRCYVTFGDIKEEEGNELAAILPRGLSRALRTKFVHCDVRSWDQQIRLFECGIINNETFSVDVVIANAGISTPDGLSILDDAGTSAVKPDTTHLDINTTALLYTAKLALHYFRRSPVIQAQDRCLILTSSMGAYIDLPGCSMYSMSKFATRGLMRSLRRGDWLGLNRVNIVAPWVRS